jgi:hypothetical protein
MRWDLNLRLFSNRVAHARRCSPTVLRDSAVYGAPFPEAGKTLAGDGDWRTMLQEMDEAIDAVVVDV